MARKGGGQWLADFQEVRGYRPTQRRVYLPERLAELWAGPEASAGQQFERR